MISFKAVADLGFAAWMRGGASRISRGRRKYQGGAKFTNLLINCNSLSTSNNNLNNELRTFIKKYVYRIAIAVTHA